MGQNGRPYLRSGGQQEDLVYLALKLAERWTGDYRRICKTPYLKSFAPVGLSELYIPVIQRPQKYYLWSSFTNNQLSVISVLSLKSSSSGARSFTLSGLTVSNHLTDYPVLFRRHF